MATENVNIHGRAGSSLPTKVTEGKDVDTRHSRYGELITHPLRPRQMLSREGTYFVAHNTTNDLATTIAGHAAPVLADADATMTKPLIHVVHSGGTTSDILIYLDFIEIEVVTAGANGTQACWATQADTGATRITSAGTALTSHSANMQSTATPLASWTAGAIVVGAESANVRRLSHGTHRPSIEIAGDKYVHVFGGDPEQFANSDAAATAIRTFFVNQPPVILGPTDYFMLALHGQASQNAAGVYKVRCGWVER